MCLCVKYISGFSVVILYLTSVQFLQFSLNVWVHSVHFMVPVCVWFIIL